MPRNVGGERRGGLQYHSRDIRLERHEARAGLHARVIGGLLLRLCSRYLGPRFLSFAPLPLLFPPEHKAEEGLSSLLRLTGRLLGARLFLGQIQARLRHLVTALVILVEMIQSRFGRVDLLGQELLPRPDTFVEALWKR